MFKEFNSEYRKEFGMEVLQEWKFELGNCYVGKNHIVVTVNPLHAYKVYDMILFLKRIQYEDDKMECMFSSTIPKIMKNFMLDYGFRCYVIYKPEGCYPLKAVLDYFDQEIDGKHVAWIITRLLNYAYFMNYQGLVTNSISINNCYICPKNHTVQVYCPWHLVPNDTTVRSTSKDIYNIMDEEAKTGKPKIKTDIDSIKLLGRIICGYENTGITSLPEPMFKFLTSETENNPDLEEILKIWDKAKRDSYGEPKFTEMDVNPNEIYKLKGDY